MCTAPIFLGADMYIKQVLERVPEQGPERVPERMPEQGPEQGPEQVLERGPEQGLKQMPERIPERVPEQVPERMPERMPEQGPIHVAYTTLESTAFSLQDRPRKRFKFYARPRLRRVPVDSPCFRSSCPMAL